MSQFDTQDTADLDLTETQDVNVPEVEVEEDLSDLSALRKAYVSEKMCPEIMPYEVELMERIKDQVDSEERMMNDRPQRPEDTLANDIHWIALDRAKYLLRAYQRVRLWKIEQHVMYVLMPENGLFNRLSQQEQEYAAKYTNMLDTHCYDTVLSRMPARFTSLVMQTEPDEEEQDEERKFDMVPEPNLDTFVFARSKSEIGNFEIDSDTIDIQKDSLYIMRYRPIRDLVLSKNMELV